MFPTPNPRNAGAAHLSWGLVVVSPPHHGISDANPFSHGRQHLAQVLQHDPFGH